jgi:hypothetical protein
MGNSLAKDIQHFNISNNDLKEIPILKGNLLCKCVDEIRFINVSGNKLTSLPLLPISTTFFFGSRNRLFMNNLNNLGALERLTVLDLSLNELE